MTGACSHTRKGARSVADALSSYILASPFIPHVSCMLPALEWLQILPHVPCSVHAPARRQSDGQQCKKRTSTATNYACRQRVLDPSGPRPSVTAARCCSLTYSHQNRTDNTPESYEVAIKHVWVEDVAMANKCCVVCRKPPKDLYHTHKPRSIAWSQPAIPSKPATARH